MNHQWCGLLPATALDKVAPQRLTASDQAVMALRGVKQRGGDFRNFRPPPAHDPFGTSLGPIGFQLALRRGKCDKDNRANGGSARGPDLAQISPRVEPFISLQNLNWKRISNPPTPGYFNAGTVTLAG